MSERTVTVAEAAQALGISEKAVRRRIERKVLPSVMGPDRRRRVPVSALEGGGEADFTSVPPAKTHEYEGPDVLLHLTRRVEELASAAGAAKVLEEVAGRDREALLEARARIQQLEQQLAERPPRRRWFRR